LGVYELPQAVLNDGRDIVTASDESDINTNVDALGPLGVNIPNKIKNAGQKECKRPYPETSEHSKNFCKLIRWHLCWPANERLYAHF